MTNPYTEDDLKDLYKFLKDRMQATTTENVPAVNQTAVGTPEKVPVLCLEDRKALRELMDQIGYVGRFDPTFLEQVLIDQGTGAEKILLEPMENLPLHVNDKDVVTKAIFEWRFSKADK